jgi:hypothetical protein
MSKPLRIVPILQALTITGFVVAAGLLLWRTDATVQSIAPVLPSLSNLAPVASSTSAALSDTIVNANIFSLSRSAPDDRTFAAGSSDALPEVDAADSISVNAFVADSFSGPSADPVPHLYGVVDGPAGAAALLRLDGRHSAAQLYREGDGAAGYRVRKIGVDRVELDGPSGGIVLHMNRKGNTP